MEHLFHVVHLMGEHANVEAVGFAANGMFAISLMHGFAVWSKKRIRARRIRRVHMNQKIE